MRASRFPSAAPAISRPCPAGAGTIWHSEAVDVAVGVAVGVGVGVAVDVGVVVDVDVGVVGDGDVHVER